MFTKIEGLEDALRAAIQDARREKQGPEKLHLVQFMTKPAGAAAVGEVLKEMDTFEAEVRDIIDLKLAPRAWLVLMAHYILHRDDLEGALEKFREKQTRERAMLQLRMTEQLQEALLKQQEALLKQQEAAPPSAPDAPPVAQADGGPSAGGKGNVSEGGFVDLAASRRSMGLGAVPTRGGKGFPIVMGDPKGGDDD